MKTCLKNFIQVLGSSFTYTLAQLIHYTTFTYKIYIFLNKMIVREHWNKVFMKKSFSGTGIRTLNLLACVFFPWHYLPSRKHLKLTIGRSNVTLISTVRKWRHIHRFQDNLSRVILEARNLVVASFLHDEMITVETLAADSLALKCVEWCFFGQICHQTH